MPEINQLSVCAWFRLSVRPDASQKALFHYNTESYRSDYDNALMIWLNQDYIQSVLRGYEEDISGTLSLSPNEWNHICWVWNMKPAKSELYLNGNLYRKKSAIFRTELPKSKGRLILGQDIDGGLINDPGNMFEGKISGFFIYKRELKPFEVSRMFYEQPIGDDVLIGWWQFKNSTSGDEIVEERGLGNRNTPCRVGWIKFGDACYFFSQSWLTWLQAEYDCNRYDGHLVSILNDEENNFIKNSIPAGNYWIGLSDSITENMFQWTDEMPLSYSKWHKDEPNDHEEGEDCVVFNEGYWNDFPCGNSNANHICKQSLVIPKKKSKTDKTDKILIGNTCPSGWKSFNKSCYLFSGLFGNTLHKKKWIDAKYYCNHLGADLVSILNENENDFIYTKLVKAHKNEEDIITKIWKTVTQETSGYWIGLHDNIFEGKFMWTDKSNYTFQKWQKEEPNNNNNDEHCIEFHSGAWNDLPCYLKRSFICKQNSENVTYLPSNNIVWTNFAGHRYLFSDFFGNNIKTLSWNAAELFCQYFDGHLASIQSQLENEYLYKVYSDNFGNRTFEYWIGFNDVVKENDFNWADGYSGNYTNWRKNEPTDSTGNEDCVVFAASGLWNDLPCSGFKNFICKSSEKEEKIKARKSDKLLPILLPILIILICLILCVIGILCRKRRHQRSKKGRLHYQGSTVMSQNSRKFFEMKSLMSDKSDKWELKHRSIKIIKEIGTGAFGKVYSASLDMSNYKNSPYVNHAENEPSRTQFAVKYLKDSASEEEVLGFQAEIDLMKRIGHHQNIINLVGCCTVKNPLCLVLEYMSHGDLLRYLRLNRTKKPFVDDTERYDIPKSVQIEISSQDLLSFAWQIACGMEYLSGQNFVHRDLAARNVLVGPDKEVKIADFGLSRFLDNDMVYTTKTNRRLPIKWMAPESIYNNEFTVSSDVWAYGIVLFEIFTIGGSPYPGISNSELLQRLKQGYRLEKVDNISDDLYEIMKSCWHSNSKQRPTFESLRESFEKMISDTAEYVTLSIDGNADYYLNPSFLTFEEEDEEEEGDNNVESSITNNPIVSVS